MPRRAYLRGRLARDAVNDLFIVAILSLLALLSVDPNSMRALLVFSLSAIAVVMIGVIALIAMIRSPASLHAEKGDLTAWADRMNDRARHGDQLMR